MRASASCSSSSSSQSSRNTPTNTSSGAGKKPVRKPPTRTNDLISSRGRRRRRKPRAVAEEEQQKVPPANEKKKEKTTTDDENKDIEDKYNEAMKAYSASPFEYQHEKGLYYHQITDSILVGTQPWEKGSIGYLKEKENVTVLFNTQEDGNFAYWKVDIGEREAEAREANVLLHRQPIVDFSFDSLREQLPEAASEFDRLMHRSEEEVIYCHCTAGMGRSPAAVIACL